MPSPETSRVRRLIVLGSTGSIGVNTLQVVEHLNSLGNTDPQGQGPRAIQVVGLAAGRKAQPLIEQARRFNPEAVAVADEAAAAQVRAALPKLTVYAGPDAALRLVEALEATDLCAAVVGSAGLPATLAGIRKGMRIGLANKETLVAAGELVVPLVQKHGATLLPVDSEHSAIFQCLNGERGLDGSAQAMSYPQVKRIVLTASGGPFRQTPKAQMDQATVEQALNHPTWNMGPKITIDSASMFNKALEIIEAHWLFGLPGERVEVIVHPQSIAHSFVEFVDHSILAQLGPPDMRTPIQYALTYPARLAGVSRPMDWRALARLDFEAPDFERFPSLKLAYQVIKAGGVAGAVFNAANEEAVAAFLDRRIAFGRIFALVEGALSASVNRPVDSLETAMAADQEARAWVRGRVG